MWRNLIILLVLVAAAFAYNSLTSDTRQVALPEESITKASDQQELPEAPDFAFTDIKGAGHHLRDYAGKTVLLNFWASWCVPCRVEFPVMISLARQSPERFVIIALSVDHDEQAMTKFIATLGDIPANFIFGRDEKKQISQDLYQTLRYPESVLITSQQRLLRKFVGDKLLRESNSFSGKYIKG